MTLPIQQETAPRRRERRVFARRRMTVDGKIYRIELRAETVAVKRLHARGGWKEIRLWELISSAIGQRMFRF